MKPVVSAWRRWYLFCCSYCLETLSVFSWKVQMILFFCSDFQIGIEIQNQGLSVLEKLSVFAVQRSTSNLVVYYMLVAWWNPFQPSWKPVELERRCQWGFAWGQLHRSPLDIKRGNSQVHHLERSRAEGPVLFLLYNQTMARASIVTFLGMSAMFINMDLVSSLAAFISYAVECFGQWKAHHYSVYAESSNTKMKESVSRKKIHYRIKK